MTSREIVVSCVFPATNARIIIGTVSSACAAVRLARAFIRKHKVLQLEYRLKDADQRAPLISQPIEHRQAPSDRERDEALLNEASADSPLHTRKVSDLDANAIGDRSVIEPGQHLPLGNGERQDHAERLTPNEGPRKSCTTCQGNGEIVTDWDRYLAGEDAVDDCPDCSGYGFTPPPEEIHAITCVHCDGAGDVGVARTPEGDWHPQECPRCAGKGAVPTSAVSSPCPHITLAMEEAGREWARTHDPSTFADIFEAMWKAGPGAPITTGGRQ